MPTETSKPGNTFVETRSTAHTLRWLALLILAALVTVAFLDMVRPFLSALVLAAILAALLEPAYRYMLAKLGGRKNLAGALTLVGTLVAIIAPMVWVGFLAAEQATGLAESVTVLYTEVAADAEAKTFPDWVPFQDRILEYWPQISAKVSQLAGSAALFLVSSLSHLTRGTASFFMGLFIFLYSLFFFVQMDPSIIRQVLSYTGLKKSLQVTIDERIVSVSRATIKGTLLIGVAQGFLGAIGFWVTGISSAAFWGVVMVIFSVIPGIGATFIVFCGAIFLAVEGQTTYAIGLALWGALVVGTIDNVLRPILVGRDAAMHDIIILISTLGGLASFGAIGIVLGPVLAGIFLTIWQTLSEASSDDPEMAQAEGGIPPSEPETPAPTVSQPADDEAGRDTRKLGISKSELEIEAEELRRELREIRRPD